MRTSTVLIVIAAGAAMCLSACGKDKDAGKDKAKQPTAAADAAAKPDPAAEEAKKKQEQIDRVAARLDEFRTAAEEDKKRWTDGLRKQVADLVAANYKNAKAALTALVAGPHRAPADVERDEYRHPVETLEFFGVRPDMKVIEVGAGGGWYTSILAPLLAKNGSLVVAGSDPEGPKDSMSTAYGVRYQLFLDSAPELYGKVEVVYVNPPDKLGLGDPDSADMALAFREMHNWHRRGYLPQYVAEVFKVLEPGGVFGVVQHRAPEGANPDESAQKGYLPEKWLIETVEKAGFKLAEKSEINANPKDTKDYEEGVWTLPPGFALEDKDRDKYAAIGESDRMTLKFVKPETEPETKPEK